MDAINSRLFPRLLDTSFKNKAQILTDCNILLELVHDRKQSAAIYLQGAHYDQAAIVLRIFETMAKTLIQENSKTV